MPHHTKADRAATVSANEARRRKEVALAELRELELAKVKGELLPAAETKALWVAITSKFRDAILRLPDKAAPAVAAAGETNEARAILRAECEAILRTLHDDLNPTV